MSINSISIPEVKTWFESNFVRKATRLFLIFDSSLIGQTWTVTDGTETYTGTVSSARGATVYLLKLSTTYTVTCGSASAMVTTGSDYSTMTETIGGD